VAILLVGLHPLAVESVAWVVGRKDVLALLLLFATLLVEDREPHTRKATVIACVSLCWHVGQDFGGGVATCLVRVAPFCARDPAA